MEIKRASVADSAEIAAMELACFADAWSESDVRACICSELSMCYAAIRDGELVVGGGAEILAADGQHKIPYMIGSTSHDVMPPILYSMSKKWCAAQQTPSYLWFFERNLPGDNHGAWHSADLWYWFGTLENGWRPFTELDRELAEEMSERLCAFARCGEPNTEKYVEWKSGSAAALTFGDNATKESKPSMFKLWVTMFTNEAPGE